MGRALKINKALNVDTGFNNPEGSSNTYGVVGGPTSGTGTQILCHVKIGSNANSAGYIIRQKGARKFLVSDGTNTGTCTLVDLDDGSLTENTMTVTVTKDDASTTRLARLTNHFGYDFSNPPNPYILSFNAAAPADPDNGQPYPIVTVASA